jgi:glycosyltransferase involved in cell wall biosynthesis
MTRISIVVPVFNEERSLESLTWRIHEALAPGPWSWELLLIDDCSRDGSLEVMRLLAAADPRVRVLHLREHAGQSAALAAGFGHARGELLVTLDADLQNDPADIPRLLERIEGHDVVSGVRAERHDDWLRRWSSRIANAVRRRVLGDTITDAGCSLKVYRAAAVRQVPVFDGYHRFLATLIQARGGRAAEIPVRHHERERGSTKYGVRNRLGRVLVDLVAARWLRSRAIDPGNVVEVGTEPARPRAVASGEALPR